MCVHGERATWVVAELGGRRVRQGEEIGGAFGEEKNIGQWVEDTRCEVSYAAFYNRLKKGIDPEEAMQKNGNRRALDA